VNEHYNLERRSLTTKTNGTIRVNVSLKDFMLQKTSLKHAQEKVTS
jgi:hypothetical protein